MRWGQARVRSAFLLALAPFSGGAAEFLLEFPVEEGHVAIAHTVCRLGHRQSAEHKQACGLAHALTGEQPLEAAAGLLLQKAREIGRALHQQFRRDHGDNL